MSECYCDFERPEFYRTLKISAARKDHRCAECGGRITPREPYEYNTAKWDGELCTSKMCQRCIAVRDWVTAHVPCFCWLHGSMLEDAANTVDTYGFEAPGLTFGYLRRLHAVRRNWGTRR